MSEYTQEQLEAADELLAEREQMLRIQRDELREQKRLLREKQDQLAEPYRMARSARYEIRQQILAMNRRGRPRNPEQVDVLVQSAVAQAAANAAEATAETED